MRTGFFGGFLTGALLSALVLGVISVLTEPRVDVPPQAGTIEVPAGSEFKQSREDTEAALPEADDTPGAELVPQVTSPEPDDLSSLQGADTAPGQQPVTGTAEGELEAPQTPSTGAELEVDSDEPVLPSPQALAPVAPEGEEDPSISTEPAQPVQPEVEENSGVFKPEEPQQPVAPEQVSDPEPAEPEEVSQPEEESQPEETEMAVEEDPGLEPSGTIGNLAEGVTTDRLPSVADEPEAEEVEELPPLVRFATPFENPDTKPLMAIVLIDDGKSPVSHDALADFPYPISYAVDAKWPGAAAAAKKYRAAGLEVLAMVDLPVNANAVDTEVAMEVHMAAVPEAVAIMEGTGSGLQASREAIEQLIPILRDSGHGLLLFSEGLDLAQKLISREGVPVASIFRDFDGNGQNATVIRRFLDQAAFRAGQEDDGVIMVGRLRGETVSALLLWGLQDRAGRVALAPVSAVLGSK